MEPSIDHPNPTRESLQLAIQAMEKIIRDDHVALYQLKEKLNHTSQIQSTIPVDVLAEIFTIAVDTDSFLSPAPFVLGAVCRAWRVLAWMTPRLWRYLSIDFVEERKDVQRQLIQEWINRSGNQILDLELFIHADGTPTSWAPTLQTFRILLKASSRWRSLRLFERSFTNLRLEMVQNDDRFPNLTSLRLEGDFRDNIPWHFRGSQMLRRVQFSGLAEADCFVGLDWSRLQDITVSMSPFDCLQVLDSSYSIKTANLEIIGSVERVFTFGAPKTLSRLETLKLSLESNPAAHGPRISWILANITTPALKTLHLSNADTHLPTQLPIFCGKSQCQLTELVLHHPKSSEAEFTHTLRNIPSIEQLSIISKPPKVLLSQLMVDLLDPNQQRSVLESLPNLSQLRYSGRVKAPFTPLLKMLQSRSASGGHDGTPRKLDLVEINFCNIEWSRDVNPNELLAFHQALALLGTDGGVKVKLNWDESRSS